MLQKLKAAQKESSKSAAFRRDLLDPLKEKLDDISKDLLTKAEHGTFISPPLFLVGAVSQQHCLAQVLQLYLTHCVRLRREICLTVSEGPGRD